jgi:hypothetical protein
MYHFLEYPILWERAGTALGVVDLRQDLAFLYFNSSRSMDHREAPKARICHSPSGLALAGNGLCRGAALLHASLA